jgi:RNA polymerase sigma-70 factor (ECF subfamily)
MKDYLYLTLNRIKTQPLSRQNFIPLVYRCKTKVANRISLVEKVLISRLKAGDDSAFSCIFTAFYKDLVIFAARFTRDLNNAEEIVQDTFVRLWEDHELINVTVSLKSYLLKIVQNKCIDWLRHRKIIQVHYNYVIENSPSFIYDTENYILYSELQGAIEASIDNLPEEVAEVFRMSRNKGLKYHEIADILRVSVRTVEVRIGKALHLLRDNLKEYLVFIVGFSCILL